MSRSIMVVAGEISGDMHLARVIRELKTRDPDLSFWGIAGDRCQAEGVEIDVHALDMAVMGLWEVLKRYPFFKRVFGQMLERVRERKPDAVLLVDYPGFNLRFAEQVHGTGPKVLYYICPQVWAWKRGRIPKMARVIDRLMVIFPFEKELFDDTGLPVKFVGHPLAVEAKEALSRPPEDVGWPGPCGVALLPGSRPQEVERMLPVMLEAARELEKGRSDVGFIIAAASEPIRVVVENVLSRCAVRPERLKIVTGKTRDVLRQARAGWVASGTATLEAALMGCPMVVVYLTSWLTFAVARRVVKVPHIGMVNVVAGREVCPELIQGAAKPGSLKEAVLPLLDDTPEREAMVAALKEVVERLGPADSYARTATALLEGLAD